MSVEYRPAFKAYPSNYIFVSKCIWYNFRQKPVETGVKNGRFWAKMTGWVVSRLWICGISPVDMWYLVSKMLYLVKSGNRWYAYVSAIWVVYVVSQKKTVFPKGEFYGFFADTLSFVSVCIRVTYTYITYITFIFFLIILPRRIYNAVFFWRQYVKRIFFQKILIGRPERSERLVFAHEYAPPVTPRPHVLNVLDAKTLGNPPVHTFAQSAQNASTNTHKSPYRNRNRQHAQNVR